MFCHLLHLNLIQVFYILKKNSYTHVCFTDDMFWQYSRRNDDNLTV